MSIDNQTNVLYIEFSAIQVSKIILEIGEYNEK